MTPADSGFLKPGEYDLIGFDLDGTLYDEFDFIRQVYIPLAERIACGESFAQAPDGPSGETVSPETLYREMCRLWRRFGSSRKDLFQQFFVLAGREAGREEIRDCIRVYRSAPFDLRLPERSGQVLAELRRQGQAMFLLTDGNTDLQRRKIHSLGLDRFFPEDTVYIGETEQKPSTAVNRRILERFGHPSRVLYIGDRPVDEAYAAASGFDFQRVRVMIPDGKLRSEESE